MRMLGLYYILSKGRGLEIDPNQKSLHSDDHDDHNHDDDGDHNYHNRNQVLIPDSSGQRLVLRNVGRRDTGVYICKVRSWFLYLYL